MCLTRPAAAPLRLPDAAQCLAAVQRAPLRTSRLSLPRRRGARASRVTRTGSLQRRRLSVRSGQCATALARLSAEPAIPSLAERSSLVTHRSASVVRAHAIRSCFRPPGGRRAVRARLALCGAHVSSRRFPFPQSASKTCGRYRRGRASRTALERAGGCAGDGVAHGCHSLSESARILRAGAERASEHTRRSGREAPVSTLAAERHQPGRAAKPQ